MKTIKLIDLLNKIANGEEVPEKIFYKRQWWKYNPINDYEGVGYGGCLLNNVCLNELNDEVEIIEEPKQIEKLNRNIDGCVSKPPTNEQIMNKLNEVIDYINGADSIVKTNDNR